jgi:uncharacterized oligopeptide transporter (OPT) family protein
MGVHIAAGMFFAVPLRRILLLKQKLKFPSGTATAIMIDAMHSSVAGAEDASQTARAIGIWTGGIRPCPRASVIHHAGTAHTELEPGRICTRPAQMKACH